MFGVNVLRQQQARDGKAQHEREVVGSILISVEPVIEADVEAEKSIHEHEGGGRDVINSEHRAIEWLNARERAGNPWPHDEAYFYHAFDKFFVRIHRIFGRKDPNGKHSQVLDAALATIAAQGQVIESLQAGFAALTARFDEVHPPKTEAAAAAAAAMTTTTNDDGDKGNGDKEIKVD